jgi:hypothetical protein
LNAGNGRLAVPVNKRSKHGVRQEAIARLALLSSTDNGWVTKLPHLVQQKVLF